MTFNSRTRIRGLLLLVLLYTVACGGGGGGGGGGTTVVPPTPPNPTLYGNLTITQDNAEVIALAVVMAEGTLSLAQTAANEVAVAEFLAGRLGFYEIVGIVEETLSLMNDSAINGFPSDLDTVIGIDRAARGQAVKRIGEVVAA